MYCNTYLKVYGISAVIVNKFTSRAVDLTGANLCGIKPDYKMDIYVASQVSTQRKGARTYTGWKEAGICVIMKRHVYLRILFLPVT